MALIISGITLPYEAEEQAALAAAYRAAGLSPGSVPAQIARMSLDLRRGRMQRVWSVRLEPDAPCEAALLGRGDPQIRPAPDDSLPLAAGTERLAGPPVVVGFGPAGLFAALVLAQRGYRPHVVERGPHMAARDRAVSAFFSGGPPDENANIQYGEGGAGAYSDGKLTTRIGDSRCALVLRLLREHGAPAGALTAQKPHIGTDLLKGIVVAMRQHIIALGGQVDFNRPVTGLRIDAGRLRGLRTAAGDIPCQTAVLAMGHSARDTFDMLAQSGLSMTPKAFSVGVRIEHLQQWINEGLYGAHSGLPGLPPGEYSLSAHVGGRGCYTFCMCPGGQVVAAASETGGVVVNGMSYHARDGRNANAALCVTVEPADLGDGLFAGVHFQRMLEQAAFEAGGRDYSAPVQRLGDFMSGRKGDLSGAVIPSYPRGHAAADLNTLLPGFVAGGIREAVARFGRKLPGFDHPQAMLTGVETRTSSPVRLIRDAGLYAPEAQGLIPCGEGAGYAGGIMSAAVDGIRAAEAIMARYRALD